MSSKVDIYKAYYEEAWANPPASLSKAVMKYFSDDFRNYDSDGSVVGDREAFIGQSVLVIAAFEDFKAVYSDIHEEGDSVIVTFHFEGKHTGDLDFSALGLGVIPASGKKIVWPETSTAFKIVGDKIVSNKPYGDSGGIADFLEPLGVKMPSA